MNKHEIELEFDRMFYGNSYELIFKPNFFQRIFRPWFGLPVDRRRIHPKDIKIGTMNKAKEQPKPRIVEPPRAAEVGDRPPLIWIREENAYFPLGVELTSLENGELVIAGPGTSRDLIVGTVSMCGLETK